MTFGFNFFFFLFSAAPQALERDLRQPLFLLSISGFSFPLFTFFATSIPIYSVFEILSVHPGPLSTALTPLLAGASHLLAVLQTLCSLSMVSIFVCFWQQMGPECQILWVSSFSSPSLPSFSSRFLPFLSSIPSFDWSTF